MAMSQERSFSKHIMFIAIAAVALFFMRGLSFWMVLVATEICTIYVCIELLISNIPKSLQTQSQANCFRLDGSRSRRRAWRERRALGRIRSDLWAAFLIAAFIGTGGVFVIHIFLFPVGLMPDVWSAFLDNPTDFKSGLRQRHIDDKFFNWSRSWSTTGGAHIRQRAQMLWSSSPIVLALAFASLVACLGLVRYSYLRTLREFHERVNARTIEYLNLDSGRLQQ